MAEHHTLKLTQDQILFLPSIIYIFCEFRQEVGLVLVCQLRISKTNFSEYALMCTLKKKEKPLVTQTWVNYVALGHFSSSSRHIEKKNRYFLSKLCTQQQTRVWEHVSLIFSNFMPSQENSPNGIFPIICGFSPIRCMDPSLKKRILVKYVHCY